MTLNLHDYFDVTPRNDSTRIFEAIKEGFAPFRYKRIDLYTEYDIDYHEYRVLAGVVLMSGYTFSHSERIGARDLLGYPDREYRRVAELMFKAFRNRENIRGVPSNIKLGEN